MSSLASKQGPRYRHAAGEEGLGESEHLLRLLQAHPEQVITATTLVVALSEQGRSREALRIAQELLRNQPDNPHVLALVRELKMQTHWTMLPLYPMQRWGWGGAAAVSVAGIIGDGPSMAKLNQELAEEIRTGNVSLTGWLKSAELLINLQTSEVSLLVSDSEGFCIALVEAMANGCCPVVTDIRSGNKQLVRDGENGFVVPVGDVEAFVEKIAYLANDRAKLLEFRQKAWETGKSQ